MILTSFPTSFYDRTDHESQLSDKSPMEAKKQIWEDYSIKNGCDMKIVVINEWSFMMMIVYDDDHL